mmetsp:Transcript_5218/g.18242  ORF Transcript_5218/g.18242 Transcript_5218/m.18242 type:complete len:593 (-) Transcript_5218:108-1886(-)
MALAEGVIRETPTALRGLSRLLLEAPFVPHDAFVLLRSMCALDAAGEVEKEKERGVEEKKEAEEDVEMQDAKPESGVESVEDEDRAEGAAASSAAAAANGAPAATAAAEESTRMEVEEGDEEEKKAEEMEEGPVGPSAEEVALALSGLGDLALHRREASEAALGDILTCSAHTLEVVRAPAINLATDVYALEPAPEEDGAPWPPESLSGRIEAFAREGLARAAAVTLETGEQQHKASGETEAGTAAAAAEQEQARGLALRHASLGVTLSAKAPQRLLPAVFAAFADAKSAQARAAIEAHMRGERGERALVHALGPDEPHLLACVRAPPAGAEPLALAALGALAPMAPTGSESAARLLSAAEGLSEANAGDAAFLVPVLAALPRERARPLLPKLVGLPTADVRAVLQRLTEGAAASAAAAYGLPPQDILVALHTIDPAREGLQLKKVLEACTLCFQNRAVFTPTVLASVLQNLVECTPLPMVFMRTVIQTVSVAPELKGFVMEQIMTRLVARQIWAMDPKLWEGFLRCAKANLPHACPVLLQLPPQTLDGALGSFPELRGALREHLAQPAARRGVANATLAVVEQDHSAGPQS